MATRRRGAALEEAILDAAWAELDGGWRRFSVETVAERAGTGKAAVYRRWPNREALARAAAVRQAGATVKSLQPTGELRRDLMEFAYVVAEAYDGPLGQAVRGIVAATGPHVEPSDPGPGLPAAQVVSAIVTAAGVATVGEADRLAVVLDAGVSLISHHALVTGKAPDAGTIATIVDDIWLPAVLRMTSVSERRVP